MIKEILELPWFSDTKLKALRLVENLVAKKFEFLSSYFKKFLQF